jgi:hypothetical protein
VGFLFFHPAVIDEIEQGKVDDEKADTYLIMAGAGCAEAHIYQKISQIKWMADEAVRTPSSQLTVTHQAADRPDVEQHSYKDKT